MLKTLTHVAESASSLVYLDHNATTPVAVIPPAIFQEWVEAWGNPSSIHWAGRKPKLLMRDARRHLAQMLHCDPLELIFTSGGSESNNLALKGIFTRLQIEQIEKNKILEVMPGLTSENVTPSAEHRHHYLLSSVEHPSLRKTAESLRRQGAQVDFIPVSRDGWIDMNAYRELLSEKTALVSVMFANNETGNLFPIQEMVQLAHQKGALFHTDAVQALGKIPIDLHELGVDFASFSGHKFYALKGVGALYVRRGGILESLIHGGGQERNRRGGTENILAICSLGAMAKRVIDVEASALRMRRLRDHFENRVNTEIEGIRVTGALAPRLPNTSSLVIEGVDGETLLMNLDMRGFAVSTGAACSSGSPEPSPTLLAMGLTRSEAQSSLRVGLGWETTEEEMDRFVDVLKEVVTHLRSFSTQPTSQEPSAWQDHSRGQLC